MKMKHFTTLQKMPKFQFSRRTNWPWRDKMLSFPDLGQKIIVNQSNAIWVIFSIKLFTCQSFRTKICGHAKLSGRFLLRLPLNSRKPKCDIHVHFGLIFSNIAIFTNLNTLILKLIVAKLNFSVKMAFWGISLWRHCANKEFSFFNNFNLNITKNALKLL